MLGPTGFGLYSLGFSFVDVMKQFSLLGLQNGVVKFGARHLEDEDHAALRACFRVSHAIVLGAGLLSAWILWSAAPAIADRWLADAALTTPLRIFAVGLPAYAWLILSQYWAWAMKRVDLDVLTVDLLQPTLFLGAIALAVGLGLGLPAIVAAWGASCAAAATFAFVRYRSLLASMPAADAAPYPVRSLLRVSLPILFVGFSYILMGHIDKLMLAHFADAAAVGLYAAAFRLSRQLGVVQGAMAPVIAPLVSALDHRRSHDDLARVYHVVTRWTMLVALPLVTISAVWGDAVLGLFGDAFRGGWILLGLLLAGQVANLGGGVAMQFLQMTGEQDRDLRILLTGLGANVVLNLLLISRYGAIGAAIATAIAFTGVAASRILAVRRKYGIWPLSRSCAKPVIAAAAMAVAGVGLRLALPSTFPFFVTGAVLMSAVYGGTLMALGLADEERRWLDRRRGRESAR